MPVQPGASGDLSSHQIQLSDQNNWAHTDCIGMLPHKDTHAREGWITVPSKFKEKFKQISKMRRQRNLSKMKESERLRMENDKMQKQIEDQLRKINEQINESIRLMRGE